MHADRVNRPGLQTCPATQSLRLAAQVKKRQVAVSDGGAGLTVERYKGAGRLFQRGQAAGIDLSQGDALRFPFGTILPPCDGVVMVFEMVGAQSPLRSSRNPLQGGLHL